MGYLSVGPRGGGPTAECYGNSSPEMDVGRDGWDYLASRHILSFGLGGGKGICPGSLPAPETK